MQHPLVQLILILLLLWTAVSVLLKTSVGSVLVPVLLVVAGLGVAVWWMLREKRELAKQLYAKPGCRQFIDVVCKVTKQQPPVDVQQEQAAIKLKEPADFDAAADTLAQVVRGHDEAIRELMAHLQRLYKLRTRAATVVKKPPLGVFLFAGPEGVGKVYAASHVGAALFSKGGLLVADLRDYRDSASASAVLFGGSNSGGRLLPAVRTQPYHTVVLENVDAAPADVLDRLGKALQAGALMDPSANGARVSFENCVFIFTTTKCVDTLGVIHADAADARDWQRRAEEVLATQTPMSAVFLSAVNAILYFAPPDDMTKAEVIALMMQRECRNHRMTLDYVAPEVLAAEVAAVSDAHGFALTPKRVERVLREPLLQAAQNDTNRLIVENVEPARHVAAASQER